ncbi:MAG: energy-coupling factor ABC transporter ATP-binding protein [Cetobacterium sp.]
MEISLSKINTGYEDLVIKDLSLEITRGTWNFIIGLTGSGKSTLLQSIGLLLENKSGDIFWKNKDLSVLKNLKEYRENCGFMFQYTEKQFFNSTIKDEIVYSLVRNRVPKELIEKKLKEVLKLLNISEDVLEKAPSELSGGQKRFVAFASVLINSPKILLLDEPTAGLDSVNKSRFLTILENLRKDGITIIQISHTLEDVLEYGDRVIVLEKGRIIDDGNPLKVLSEYNMDFFKFCKIMKGYGIKLEGAKNIEQFLEGVKNYEK